MTTSDTDGNEFTGFEMGDVVEHRMNTNVFGVVVGFQGSLIGLRVSPSLVVLWFHEFELRPVDDDDFDEPPAKEEEPGDAQEGNVINFTEAKELRAGTKTRGVA